MMFGLATSSTPSVHLPPSQIRCPRSAPRHSSTAPSDMLKLPSRQSAPSSLPIQFKNCNISTGTKASKSEAVRQRTGTDSLSLFFITVSLFHRHALIGGDWKFTHLDEVLEEEKRTMSECYGKNLYLDFTWT